MAYRASRLEPQHDLHLKDSVGACFFFLSFLSFFLLISADASFSGGVGYGIQPLLHLFSFYGNMFTSHDLWCTDHVHSHWALQYIRTATFPLLSLREFTPPIL